MNIIIFIYLDILSDTHSLQFSRMILHDTHVPATEHFVWISVVEFATFLYIAFLEYAGRTGNDIRKTKIL